MKNRHSSTFVQLGLAALLVVSITIGASTPAGATTGLTFNTKFEIDGNPQLNDPVNGGDWLSTAAQYPSLRDNIVTTPAAEPCGPGSDPTRIVQGNSLDDINVNDPSPFVEAGNVNIKDDICAVRRAWELRPVGGQYHFITYLAWSRVSVQGEINVLIPVLGSDPNSQTDDIVISYDFDDNTGVTSLSFLRWNGTTWGEGIPLPAGSFQAATGTGITDPAVPAPQGTNLTFGEYAIDLTAAGLLPEAGPCATFTSRGLVSRTGNSPSATLMDAVVLPPQVLTNCSSLNIVKQTTPTPTSAKSFGYNVSQLDGGITPILGSITVPPNPNSTTINDLLISPDYVVGETSLPAGWTEQSLICTSVDPLTGLPVTRRLFGPAPLDASFPLGPNIQATCTIANIGPPAVTLTKSVLPASATGWSFAFTISPATGVTPGATQTVTSASPSVTWDNLTAGTAYTITETDAPRFQEGTISCNGDGATFTPVAGQVVTCTATNTQLARITVVKDAAPADNTEFGFSATNVGAPDPFTLTDPAAPSATFADLVPGQTSTIAETLTQAQIDAGWKAVSVACIDALDSSAVQGTVGASGGTVDVTTKPGSDITCAFSNAQGGSITIQKAADPVGTPDVFPFTVTGPAGAVLPPQPILLDVNSDPTNPAATTIGNLPPGTYTVSEATPGGWLLSSFSCSLSGDGSIGTPDPATGTVTFAITEGQNVVCSYVNTQLASVDVTKTVAGDAPTWAFDFTIAPVPAGETATKSATNSAATVRWAGLTPGTVYSVTEANAAGFITGTLTCTGGTDAVGTSTFTPTAGLAVTCAITNDVVEQLPPPVADIAVVKTATPTVVTPGGNVTWTLAATNNGPDAADNVTIVDHLPSTLTLVSFTSPAGWDCSATVTGNPGTLSCAKPTMGLNESATFTLTTTVAAAAAGTTINNTAVVSTTTGETTTSNNQDSEPITVQVAVLPPTGASDVWVRLAIAASLVLAGGLLLAIDRRRRITP